MSQFRNRRGQASQRAQTEASAHTTLVASAAGVASSGRAQAGMPGPAAWPWGARVSSRRGLVSGPPCPSCLASSGRRLCFSELERAQVRLQAAGQVGTTRDLRSALCIFQCESCDGKKPMNIIEKYRQKVGNLYETRPLQSCAQLLTCSYFVS